MIVAFHLLLKSYVPVVGSSSPNQSVKTEMNVSGLTARWEGTKECQYSMFSFGFFIIGNRRTVFCAIYFDYPWIFITNMFQLLIMDIHGFIVCTL